VLWKWRIGCSRKGLRRRAHLPSGGRRPLGLAKGDGPHDQAVPLGQSPAPGELCSKLEHSAASLTCRYNRSASMPNPVISLHLLAGSSCIDWHRPWIGVHVGGTGVTTVEGGGL
jgi:hypothetical protein